MKDRHLITRITGELSVLQDPQEFFRQFKATWRIALMVVGAQLTAGAVGLAIDPFSEPLKNFWAAGVLVTLPAVVVGSRWELKDAARAKESPRAIRIFYLLVALGLFLIGLANFAIWFIVGNR